MGLINITDETDGTLADAADLNTRFATVLGLVNGNIDNANISAGGVSTANLANESVTTAKLADGVVSPSKWRNPYTFKATRTTTQNLTVVSTFNKVQLNTEDYDTNSNFDSTTNFRYVAPFNGVYHFDAYVRIQATAGDVFGCSLFKNGSNTSSGDTDIPSQSFSVNYNVTDTLNLVAGDYIELYALNGAGVTKVLESASLSGFIVSQT